MSFNFSRRGFLIQGTAAAGLLSSPGWARAMESSDRKVVHIIGHSHIDAAWLWPWRDGEDAVFNTFRSALNRMKENPQFCYSHSSSAHYQWVERADPKMFAEIRQRIREGRWEVVGAWPVEPDCNIPATESFIRHALYGKKFCRESLGVDVKIGFNPDSFGHAAGLPTILKHCGYDAYVFMRPQEHEMDLPILFWWEGPDGSRILTLRIWKEYDGQAKAIPAAVEHIFAAGLNHGAFFLGVGDHGGAVTAEQVREVAAMQSDASLPELRFSTLGQFFAAILQSPAAHELPVVKTELQHHSRGCYSAYGEGKIANRRAERSLVESETITSVAMLYADHAYPGSRFAESWWKVLFCQFHDMMAGTSLYADYRDVRDSLGFAGEVADTAKVEALHTLAKNVDTSKVKESSVFAFNPLPWPRKALLQFHIEKDPDHHGLITQLVKQDGGRVPLQFIRPDSMTVGMPRLTATVDLPACGYQVFELGHGDPPQASPYGQRVKPSEVGFGVSSIKTTDGIELLSAPVGLVVLSDMSDTWSHDVKQFREEIGRPELVSVAVVEDGPVCRVTRHRAIWKTSEIILDMVEYAGVEALELRLVIDWHEHQEMMKLEIPTRLLQPRLFAKVPGGILERKTNGEEEPYQDWAAVQGNIAGTEYTVAILNNSTYSYDCLDGLFRTVVIRSAPFARHQPSPTTYFDTNAWQDQGRQERTFWLTASKGEHTEMALDRLAEELQTPAEYVVDSAHEGDQPWEKSLLEVQPASVSVLAMKQQESGVDGTILRIQERAGRPTQATLKGPIVGADQSISLKPWELKTVHIRKTPGGKAEVREISPLEV